MKHMCRESKNSMQKEPVVAGHLEASSMKGGSFMTAKLCHACKRRSLIPAFDRRFS